MNERSRYLLKNTASLALGKVGTKLIAFFLVPLYTHVLSAAQYGTVDLIMTISMLLAPLLMLNLNEAVMRFSLDKGADRHGIMSAGLAVLLLTAAAALLLIPLAERIETLAPYSWYLYAYVLSAALMQMFLACLRGQEKLAAYSIANIICTAAAAVLNVLFLLVFRWGIEGYLLAFIFANLLSAIYAAGVGRVHTVLKNFHLDWPLNGVMVRYAMVLLPSSFMWWVIHSSDRIMVTAMVGAAANGIYAVSYKVPSLLSTLSESFSHAWSYSAIREEDSEDKASYYNSVYHHMVQVLFLLSTAVLLLIKPFLSLYVADEYYEAWNYVPFLLIGFVFLSLASFIGSIYTVHKNSLGFLLSSLTGAVVNLILNMLLIPYIDVYGAALATAFSYFVVYLFRVIHTRRYMKLRFVKRQYLVYLLFLIVMSITLFWESAYSIVIQILFFLLALCLCRDFLREICCIVIRILTKRAA